MLNRWISPSGIFLKCGRGRHHLCEICMWNTCYICLRNIYIFLCLFDNVGPVCVKVSSLKTGRWDISRRISGSKSRSATLRSIISWTYSLTNCLNQKLGEVHVWKVLSKVSLNQTLGKSPCLECMIKGWYFVLQKLRPPSTFF